MAAEFSKTPFFTVSILFRGDGLSIRNFLARLGLEWSDLFDLTL